MTDGSIKLDYLISEGFELNWLRDKEKGNASPDYKNSNIYKYYIRQNRLQ